MNSLFEIYYESVCVQKQKRQIVIKSMNVIVIVSCTFTIELGSVIPRHL